MSDKISAIEVERKFHVPKDCDVKLTDLGAKFISEIKFHDIYYDTHSWDLTLSDHWLRKREEKWELKCPPGNRRQSCSTQYEEFEEENNILHKISLVLSIKSNTSLSDLIDSQTIKPFASYTTKRKNYNFDGVEIVLDQTDFGFNVGEVEVMAKSEAEIQEALQKVDDIVQQLGKNICFYSVVLGPNSILMDYCKKDITQWS